MNIHRRVKSPVRYMNQSAFYERGQACCKSQNEHTVKRNGKTASERQCLFWVVLCLLKIRSLEKQGRMDLEANSSVWHTWFV